MEIDSLYARLRADPDHEPTWSVLGDALAEAGDPRGELIALSQRPVLDDAGRERLVAIHRSLLPRPAPEGLRLSWRRGFVTDLRVTDPRGLEGLRSLLDAEPLLAGVALGRREVGPREIEAVAQLAGIARVQRVDLRHADLVAQHVPAVVGLLEQAQPGSLDLRDNPLPPLAFRRLARSPTLSCLETLAVQATPELVASPHLHARSLDLSHCDHHIWRALTEGGARRALRLAPRHGWDPTSHRRPALEAWERMLDRFDGLERLEVALGGLADAAVARLLAAPRVALEELVLDGQLGDGSASAIADTSALPRLRVLRLCSPQLTQQAADALACSQRLARLEVLDLTRSKGIGHAGVRALATAPGLPVVQQIRVAERGVEVPTGSLRPVWGGISLLTEWAWVEATAHLVERRSCYLLCAGVVFCASRVAMGSLEALRRAYARHVLDHIWDRASIVTVELGRVVHTMPVSTEWGEDDWWGQPPALKGPVLAPGEVMRLEHITDAQAWWRLPLRDDPSPPANPVEAEVGRLTVFYGIETHTHDDVSWFPSIADE